MKLPDRQSLQKILSLIWGYSFTHLFSEQDRRKVLAEFYAALEYGGLLILGRHHDDGILATGLPRSTSMITVGITSAPIRCISMKVWRGFSTAFRTIPSSFSICSRCARNTCAVS